MPQVQLFVSVNKSLYQESLSANTYRRIKGDPALTRAEAESLLGGWNQNDQVFEVVGTLPDFALYQVKQNSDMDEGRGAMRVVGSYGTFEDAFRNAQGRGVMGVGNGDIVIRSSNVDTNIYSGTFGLNGDYFKVVTRAPVIKKVRAQAEDKTAHPEYAEYLRLKEIFG